MKRKAKSIGEYGVLETKIWAPEKDIQDKVFEKEGALLPMKLEYIDIPDLFRNTAEGINFIYALEKTERLDLFAIKTVQIIIDHQWKYWRVANGLVFGLPAIINLAVFWYYSNIVLPNLNDEDDSFRSSRRFCLIIMNSISVFFILNELPIIYNNWRREVDVERFANWIASILIVYNTVTDDYHLKSFWSIQAWTAFFIWLQVLLYLRTWESFSWLIRMIMECIKEFKAFLFIFLIGVLAFADTFRAIEKALIIKGELAEIVIPDDATWYETYFESYIKTLQLSFRTALGDFDESLDSYRATDWIIFFLCAIFNIILLLNLLIAIISEIYTDVSSTRIETSYKEKVNTIALMQDSFLFFL